MQYYRNYARNMLQNFDKNFVISNRFSEFFTIVKRTFSLHMNFFNFPFY